jgi:hypothetical protein
MTNGGELKVFPICKGLMGKEVFPLEKILP